LECSTPRIGSSWGYMHVGTIHSPICTSCIVELSHRTRKIVHCASRDVNRFSKPGRLAVN
jgi:hypothetical protein